MSADIGWYEIACGVAALASVGIALAAVFLGG